MQSGGTVSWEECVRQRELYAGYLAGAEEILRWEKNPRCISLSGNENLICALRGYNGGTPSIDGKWVDYVNSVTGVRARIHYYVLRLADPTT